MQERARHIAIAAGLVAQVDDELLHLLRVLVDVGPQALRECDQALGLSGLIGDHVDLTVDRLLLREMLEPVEAIALVQLAEVQGDIVAELRDRADIVPRDRGSERAQP